MGKLRGLIEMADYCDRGMILWDRESVGTVDMIDKLFRACKPYEVWDDLGLWVSGFIKTCE